VKKERPAVTGRKGWASPAPSTCCCHTHQSSKFECVSHKANSKPSGSSCTSTALLLQRTFPPKSGLTLFQFLPLELASHNLEIQSLQFVYPEFIISKTLLAFVDSRDR
jgi:hypothetical protein